MGIRFLCDHCQKRLNVKQKQAGAFCICPGCGKEIQIPLDSTIEPRPHKSPNRKRPVAKNVTREVELTPVAGAANDTANTTDDEQSSNTVIESQRGSVQDRISSDSESESAFDAAEKLDSGSLLVEALGLDDRGAESVSSDSDTESFRLSKPAVKVEADPLRSDPDLVWYLRHKRLGEKGPLKVRQVEAMLESGQICAGYIVWREDWNDWLPVEQVFKSSGVEPQEKESVHVAKSSTAATPASRKRRAQRRFWICFNAAAFILVLLLVYLVTQFGL